MKEMLAPRGCLRSARAAAESEICTAAGHTMLRVLVVSLALRSAVALEVAPRRNVAHHLGRRECFGGIGAAAAAFAFGRAAPAYAESVPTEEELMRLTRGYERLQLLLKDYYKITAGKCAGAVTAKEGKQVAATNGGALCDKNPLAIQDYIGYKSMNDPLFKAEKLMLRASPLVKDSNRLDEYLEAVNSWGEKAQMSSLMAYTSSWGEANPNGGKGVVDAYLEDAKYDLEESADLLKRILQMLDLPLKAPKA